jgi:hypothetical protein
MICTGGAGVLLTDLAIAAISGSYTIADLARAIVTDLAAATLGVRGTGGASVLLTDLAIAAISGSNAITDLARAVVADLAAAAFRARGTG